MFTFFLGLVRIHKIISPILAWRLRNLSHRNFLILLSAILGLVVGAFAVGVKYSIHETYEVISGLKSDTSAFTLFFFPIIGIILATLVYKKIFKEQIGHGVTKVLYKISKGSSILKKRDTLTSVSTAIITILFGGSVGLEAPLVISGSAFGSNVGQLMRLHYKSRTLLIGCGTAAAISGIFNSPITGVIFAIEVILAELTIEKFVPILIASVCGSIFPMIFSQNDALFNFQLMESYHTSDVPFYIALGVVCGFVALYFTRTHFFIEGKLNNISSTPKKIAVGGLSLCVLIFLFPSLYGEGYATIKSLFLGNEDVILNRNIVFRGLEDSIKIPLVLFLMIFAKALASSCTLGAGGSGGIFAPSLFVGGATGYLFARTSNSWGLSEGLSTGNFTLVGMSGIVSGVLHAPLTGIFLIAEITGGYTLFVPLMIVSAIAYATISVFERHSIYTKHLVENGDLILGNKDQEILSLINKEKLITQDEVLLHHEMKLIELIDIMKTTDKIIFPVINNHNKLCGVLIWNDIKSIIFDPNKNKEIRVKTVMHQDKTYITEHDTTQDIMSKFERVNKSYLAVVNPDNSFSGFIYKDTLYKHYRDRLIKQYQVEA